MGKVIDITDKLSFDENPKLKIRDIEAEVNADAPTMLKLMQIVGDGKDLTANDVIKMYDLIFSEDSQKKIDKLKLPFTDFQTLVMSAMSLVTGDVESGE